MAARNCLALKLITEAVEGDLQDLERQNRSKKRLELSAITETHFVQRYRITKCAFEYLCSHLREKSGLRSSQRVSLETKVLSALLFYANGDYQRVIGIANNLSQEAVSRYVEEVTEALNHPNVVKSYIRFPDTAEARDRIKQKYKNASILKRRLEKCGDIMKRYNTGASYFMWNFHTVVDPWC